MHRAALAMFHARLGEADEARRHLRHFTETDFATLPRITHWFPGMVMLADAATWLRDADAAARIRELLEPVSGRTAWNVFTALWPIDIALAQLCVVLGDHARAHALPRCRRAHLRAREPRRPPRARSRCTGRGRCATPGRPSTRVPPWPPRPRRRAPASRGRRA